MTTVAGAELRLSACQQCWSTASSVSMTTVLEHSFPIVVSNERACPYGQKRSMNGVCMNCEIGVQKQGRKRVRKKIKFVYTSLQSNSKAFQKAEDVKGDTSLFGSLLRMATGTQKQKKGPTLADWGPRNCTSVGRYTQHQFINWISKLMKMLEKPEREHRLFSNNLD